MKKLSRNEMRKVMGGDPVGCVVICYNRPLDQYYPIAICNCGQAVATCASGGWEVYNCSCGNHPCEE